MTKHNHIDTGLFNRKTFSSLPESSAREDNIDHYPFAQLVDVSKVTPTPSPPESLSTARALFESANMDALELLWCT